MIKKVEIYLIDIATRQKSEKVLFQYSENPMQIIITSSFITQIETSDIDLLDCYRKVQKSLEEKGYLMSLNGSRIDVQASGFLRDSTNGVSTYQFTHDFVAEKPVLNIFHLSDVKNIGTISEQKEFMKKWKIEYKKHLQQQSG